MLTAAPVKPHGDDNGAVGLTETFPEQGPQCQMHVCMPDEKCQRAQEALATALALRTF